MSNSSIQQLKSIVHELEQLCIKSQNHIKEQVSSDKYVFTNVYHGWINEYNQVIGKYNKLTTANLSSRNLSEHDLSSTNKTVRFDVAKSFMTSFLPFGTTSCNLS